MAARRRRRRSSEDGRATDVAKFRQSGLEMMVVEGAPSLSPWLLLLRVSTVELFGFIFTHFQYCLFRSEDGRATYVAKFRQSGLEMMVVEGAPSLSPWLLLRVSTVELYGFIFTHI